MAINGLRDTSNFIATARPLNWREGIILQMPSDAGLFAMTALMKSKKVSDDHQFNWYEKSYPSQRFALQANIAAASAGDADTVSLETNAGDEIRAGYVLQVEETGEQLLVTSNPSTDTISVQRGFAGTTPTTVDYDGSGVNPYTFVLNEVSEENSAAPQPMVRDAARRYNVTQIMRHTYAISRTAKSTRVRTGDEVREMRRETLMLHNQAWERTLWEGQRWEGTKNGRPARQSGGILWYMGQYASDNVVDNAGTAVDMDQLEAWLQSAFKWGSRDKMGFVGDTALTAIQQVIRKNTAYNIEYGVKEFGMMVNTLHSPFGRVHLKEHPLWKLQPGGTQTTAYYGRDSWLAILDMQQLVWRFMPGANTTHQNKLEENDTDGQMAGFITEAGLEVHQPENHYIIKGFASGAADS